MLPVALGNRALTPVFSQRWTADRQIRGAIRSGASDAGRTGFVLAARDPQRAADLHGDYDDRGDVCHPPRRPTWLRCARRLRVTNGPGGAVPAADLDEGLSPGTNPTMTNAGGRGSLGIFFCTGSPVPASKGASRTLFAQWRLAVGFRAPGRTVEFYTLRPVCSGCHFGEKR